MKTSIFALLPLAAWVSATADHAFDANEDDCPEETSSYAPIPVATPSFTYVPKPVVTGAPPPPYPGPQTSTLFQTQYNTKPFDGNGGVVIETIVVPIATTVCPFDSTTSSYPVASSVPSGAGSFPPNPVVPSGAPPKPYPPPATTTASSPYGTVTAPVSAPTSTSPVIAGAVSNARSSGGLLAAVAGLIAALL